MRTELKCIVVEVEHLPLTASADRNPPVWMLFRSLSDTPFRVDGARDDQHFCEQYGPLMQKFITLCMTMNGNYIL